MTIRALVLLAAILLVGTRPAAPGAPTKRIAFIVESWYPTSHADVIGTRLLEGYRIDSQTYASPITIASVFTDSPRPNDQTRTLASRYRFRVASSIADALLDDPHSGSPRLMVDGIFVGTREDPPRSGQLSSPTPRLQTFQEILRVLDLSHSIVPIFLDKMIAANWQDSRTIVAEAERRGIPLMGGSVLSFMPLDRPVAPAEKLEVGAVVAAGPYWAYAFHAAELLQSLMERRTGQETGVSSVQDVGPGLWSLPDRDRWGAGLVDEMLKTALTGNRARPGGSGTGRETRILLLQYADGSRGVLALMPRAFDDSEFILGARTKGGLALGGVQLRGPPFDHFGYLARALVEFYATGRPTVPIAHTLLTTGIVLHGQLAVSQGFVNTPSMTFSYTPSR